MPPTSRLSSGKLSSWAAPRLTILDALRIVMEGLKEVRPLLPVKYDNSFTEKVLAQLKPETKQYLEGSKLKQLQAEADQAFLNIRQWEKDAVRAAKLSSAAAVPARISKDTETVAVQQIIMKQQHDKAPAKKKTLPNMLKKKKRVVVKKTLLKTKLPAARGGKEGLTKTASKTTSKATVSDQLAPKKAKSKGQVSNEEETTGSLPSVDEKNVTEGVAAVAAQRVPKASKKGKGKGLKEASTTISQETPKEEIADAPKAKTRKDTSSIEPESAVVSMEAALPSSASNEGDQPLTKKTQKQTKKLTKKTPISKKKVVAQAEENELPAA
eukprot:CAMPEP_0176438922 /NCGR_PEP_ID=MMETSP0127-20121128/19606_1 /TAXON_ID=938130 /ORGANISM="Platyophrya macrostoma, Strain WH" /LENGTH=325 /DNA_ID=CAMNT_0017823033 /DNA_START=43 /DNA_END=1020 /DNA_ORIENTATION=-